MTRSSLLALFGTLAMGLSGSACSGSGDDDGTVVDTKPVIETFSVDKELVQSGDTVTLTWKVVRATKITINQTGQLPTETPRVEASQPFVIQEDTTFELVAENDQGETASASLMVNVDGIRIESFAASATTINRRETVTLTWSIVGEEPESVTITDGDGAEVYSGTEANGSQDVQPEDNVEYTLTATGMTGTKMATVMITVQSQRPTIVRFQALPSATVLIGEEVGLFWETTADQVQVLENGTPVRPWTERGAEEGNLQRPITAQMTTFTLQARNSNDETDVIEETVVVMGVVTPSFTTFTVTPNAYTESSTVATVTWEAVDTDSLELRVNNTVVNGFPTTQLSGSFQVNVTGEPLIRLLATNAATTIERNQRVAFGFDEPEPNDPAENAITIPGDRVPWRGTISDAMDTDWYAVMVPQNSLMYVRAGIVQTMGVDVCSFDTIVRVYTSTGTEIGFNDNGPVGTAPCSVINPLLDTFAANMDAGVYYISVGGVGGDTGQYSLEVDIFPAPAPLPATTTMVGTPNWGVGGFSLWAQDVGAGGANLATPVDEALSPFRGFGAVGNGFPILLDFPLAAIDRADYSDLLPLFLTLNGKQNTATFTTAQLTDPMAVIGGFTFHPLMGAPTGPSFDFNNGPIIANGLWEIDASLTINQNGTAVFPTTGPLGIPAFSQYAAIGLMPVNGAGDGDSHRHIFGFMSTFVNAPANLAGNWEFVWNFRDTTGAGWDVTLPFTVQ